MVVACAKALLPAQGTLAGIHQVAKKLPACGRLIAAQPFCLCHTATQPVWWNLSKRLSLLASTGTLLTLLIYTLHVSTCSLLHSSTTSRAEWSEYCQGGCWAVVRMRLNATTQPECIYTGHADCIGQAIAPGHVHLSQPYKAPADCKQKLES